MSTVAQPTLRTLHRWTAALLVIFIAAHIGNHLSALGGVGTHISVMNALRHVYRQPVVEAALLLAFGVQIVLGLLMVRRAGLQKSLIGRLQHYSGLYLAFFLVVHVSAVFAGRTIFGLDTNFFFAAAGDHVPWAPLFFVPYYSLAVLGVFTHIGCALHWIVGGAPARPLLIGSVACGAIAGLIITGCLAGILTPVTIPDAYLAPYALLL